MQNESALRIILSIIKWLCVRKQTVASTGKREILQWSSGYEKIWNYNGNFYDISGKILNVDGYMIKVIPLLNIYLKSCTFYHRDNCISMFSAALFTKAKKWSQL